MEKKKEYSNKEKPNQSKRPFEKSDFEAVLKTATKPLKKDQDEKEPEET